MHDELDAAINSHCEEVYDFLEELVRVPSMHGSEQAALEVFAREAEAVGLNIERLPFSNDPMADERAGRFQSAEPLDDNRYQVLACTPGSGDLLVLLNGHMDVVPVGAPELWTTPPFGADRRGGRLYGRGAADMKCGFAIGVLALRALRDVAPNLFGTQRLGYLAVVEEECTGNGALRSIIENNVTAEEVIVLESTDLGLMIGGIGVLWIEITVLASSGHAHAPDANADAVDLSLRLVDRLREWSEELRQTEVNPALSRDVNPYAVNLGKLNAGDWTSSMPARATLSVRVGYPCSWTPDEAERKVKSVISSFAAEDPAYPVQPVVTLSGLRAKGYMLDKDAPLVRDLGAAHAAAHGAQPRVFAMASTTDARAYINDFGIPAVCYGAVGRGLHGIDEYVELQSIVDAARTLSRFLLSRFSNQGVST